uniref:Inorganic phosphate transporter 1-4-like n=2 Tax=Nicotiana TaxID=4085 RepID=A0A1S4DKB1_TOBAC|nr:PREDICTED: inorganic phosphate transporter 1-4-like [Nicotiana tabacum]
MEPYAKETMISWVLQVDIDPEDANIEQMSRDETNKFGIFSWEFVRHHGLHLFGTTSTWFLLDIAFYSQKDVFSAIGWIPAAKTMNVVQEVYKIARAQTLIALLSTVPGYWFTVAFIDVVGRSFAKKASDKSAFLLYVAN